tara:strand:- start:2901 stop:5753 length:2853 start_codon:yes stop_codon:yes gene_type:complete
MPATRHFLGWKRPTLELVGEFLMGRAEEGMLDLSELLVIVPTRNAGRRLREMLANLAHEKGKAMLAPQVVPTEFLLSLISTPESGKLATAEESQLAWIYVLLRADLERFHALFPVAPVRQDFAWAQGMARGLAELRQTLGESALEMEDIPKLVAEEFEDEDRWLELAKLEAAFKKQLARHDLHDAVSVRKRAVKKADLPPGVREIVVAATPDPIPIALQVLQQISHQIPTQVLIHAPEELAEAFDGWGRPISQVWRDHEITIRDEEQTIHVLPDSLAQAEALTERICVYEDPSQSATIGVLDEEVAPAIERSLSSAGIATFNPQGKPLRTQGALHFFRALGRLLKDRSYHSFIELLRCPDYLAFLSGKLMFWDTASVFRRFDDLYQEHLPQNLRDLRHFMRIGKSYVTLEMLTALNDTEALLRTLQRKPLATCLPEILHDVFSARAPMPGSEGERILRLAWERLSPILDALGGPLAKPLKLKPAESFDLILQFLEAEQLYDERPLGAVELLGWLELGWDDAPHLLVSGFNDGMVPESIVGDVYLPERLRVILAKHADFKTNEDRLARDAFLFESILRCREDGGRVDVMFGKRSRKGDPLRPSRLLFRCPEAQLAERVNFLFREVDTKESNLPWTPGFLLKRRTVLSKLETIGVTAFRDYLTSPLHFYLRHIEKMRSVDGEKLELDAAGFGTFCHEVLRRFGEDSGIKDSRDEDLVRSFFQDTLDQLAKERFGGEMTLPVKIQLRSAMQRLSAAAAVQVREREQGWRIEEVELNLESEIEIDGVAVRGKVDRIDRNEKTGEVRVLDYKTTDKGDDPQRVHVSKVTSSTNLDWLPDYARFELAGKEYRWKDLQLPLYRLSLTERFGPQIRCGFFNLPKAAGDTGISMFQTLQKAHDQAAQECAEGVIADVKAERFWPVKVPANFDDFASMHLGLPEKTFAIESFHPVVTESS